MIDTLLEVVALKALPRAGWVQRGVTGPESVAGHSWGVAWLTAVLLPPELDRERALTYAILHDLAEVRVGDITPADGVPAAEKAHREHAAMQEICAGLPGGGALVSQWHAYEEQRDAEARFVRQLDRLDMALQAVAYMEAGHAGMLQFVQTADAFIVHPALRPLMTQLGQRARDYAQ